MLRWFCLLTIITFGEAVEVLEADSDFGELLIVRNETANDDWGVLYVEHGIYLRSGSSERICSDYDHRSYPDCSSDNFIEFFPTKLTIQRRQNMGNNSFPRGLIQLKFFERLQYLDMTNSKLESVDRNEFSNRDALERLNLSSNVFTNIPSLAFSSARNLTNLDLSYNQITDIASDAFNLENDSSSNLQTLRLNHNKLTYIDFAQFAHSQRQFHHRIVYLRIFWKQLCSTFTSVAE